MVYVNRARGPDGEQPWSSHLCRLCHRKTTSCWCCWGLDSPDFLELGERSFTWAFSVAFFPSVCAPGSPSVMWIITRGLVKSGFHYPGDTRGCAAGPLFLWVPHPPIHPVEDTHGKTAFVLNKYRLSSWLLLSNQSGVTAAYTAALVRATSHLGGFKSPREVSRRCTDTVLFFLRGFRVLGVGCLGNQHPGSLGDHYPHP